MLTTNDLLSTLIGKGVVTRQEFENLNLENILHNWEACMDFGPAEERNSETWSLPPAVMLKFNVDDSS